MIHNNRAITTLLCYRPRKFGYYPNLGKSQHKHMLILAVPPHLTKCLFQIIWAPCIHFYSTLQYAVDGGALFKPWLCSCHFPASKPSLASHCSEYEGQTVTGLQSRPVGSAPITSPTSQYLIFPNAFCTWLSMRGKTAPVLRTCMVWWGLLHYITWIPLLLCKWAIFDRVDAGC